jgi:hypothetical protein
MATDMLDALTTYNQNIGKPAPEKDYGEGYGKLPGGLSTKLSGLLKGGMPAIPGGAGGAGAVGGEAAGVAGAAGAAEGAAGAGAAAGGAMGIAELLPFLAALCDVRCKENIIPTGEMVMGVPEYEFSYIGDTSGNRYSGPMAQDLEKMHPELVVEVNGYKLIPAELRKMVV